MGSSRGAADRTDALHQLPLPVARGASQILQQIMRWSDPTAPLSEIGGGRGSSDQTGDRLDLTARCEHCAGALLDTARSNQKYCNAHCRNAARMELVSRARAEAVAGRVCQSCGAPIEASRRVGVKFCNPDCCRDGTADRLRSARVAARLSKTCLFCEGPMRRDYRGYMYCSRVCAWRSARDLARMLRKRNCAHCDKPFRASAEGQRFCSKTCHYDSIRSDPTRYRVCNWCGDSFRLRRASRRFCSHSCAARGREAKKRVLDFKPAEFRISRGY